jgi:hypothetical protein
VVIALLLAAALVGACSQNNDATTATGGGSVANGNAGTCTAPAPGCPCATPGEMAPCGSTISVSGNTVKCQQGTMTCERNSTWGTCWGTTVARAITRGGPRPDGTSLAPPGRGPHQLDLATDASSCGDPCDPYCEILSDTPSGLDAGVESGLAIDDAGLSLAISPNPPVTPCTGITVSPSAATITLTSLNPSPAPAQQYNASYTPSACFSGNASALWTISPANVATIDGTGKVTVVNPIAGTLTITAYAGSYHTTATLTVTVDITDTSQLPSGVTAGQLSGAGAGTDGLTILYPYASTVFPLGLIPPTTQWAWTSGGSAAQAVAVSLLYPADGSVFSYTEIVPEQSNHYDCTASSPANVNCASPGSPNLGFTTAHASATDATGGGFPSSIWTSFTQTAIGQTAYISVQRLAGGQLYPAKTIPIKLATDQLKGTVYYNTYGTNVVLNFGTTYNGGAFGAATLGISPGATAPYLVEGYADSSYSGAGCRVCHSVSSDGNRLVTQQFDSANGGGGDQQSDTLSLPGGTEQQMLGPGNAGAKGYFSWPALFHDGSLFFTNAAGLAGAATASNSALYSTATAASPTLVSVSGLPAFKAGTPAFSPDGKHVAFNFNGGSGKLENLADNARSKPDGVSIGVLDFDGVSAFSNGRVVATPGSNGATSSNTGGGNPSNILWFPAFTPDDSSVIFHYETYGNGRDTAATRSQCDARGPTTCQDEGSHAELWWVPTSNSATGAALYDQTSNRLNCLNGISDVNCPSAATGTSYLPPHAAYAPPYNNGSKPQPPASYAADWNMNYEPTVLPQAAGGYAWVVFTSRRAYGNIATVNPYWSDPRFEDLSVQPTTKKLWVAAIDLNAAPGTDPSHPAFYLDGQELLAGNSRGYFVLNQCESAYAASNPSASLCTSNLDCCAGEICELDAPAGPSSHCQTAPSPACVADGSPCVTGQICCDTSALCSQQTSTCVVPPPLPYYVEADFVRTYTNPCASGSRPVWLNFEYGTITPSDSQVIIDVETANSTSVFTDTVDAGAANASAPLVQLPTVVEGATVTYPNGSQNVEAALEAAGLESGLDLEVIVRLIPSSDGRSAPSLVQWSQTFDCAASQ